jgi:short-subunit dehydrogenase
MRSLNGKIVVITGAASGIGAALAAGFARKGARLMLADIDAPGLDRVAAALRAAGCDCHTRVTDTASEEAIHVLAAHTAAQLGAADVVINNAGVGLIAPVEGLNTSDAHWLMNINFWGVVHGCQAFLPQLRSRPESVLVNISSIFAMISMPTQSIYNAAKAAVRGFSDALREELRDTPVRVLCVHPGGIRTNIANRARITDSSMVADSDQEMRDNFLKMVRTTPEQAAHVIISAIESGKTRVLIGTDARIMDFLFRLAPSRSSAWMTAIGHRMRRSAQKQRLKGTP